MTRIIAVVVDTQNLTMYKTDGSTIVIAQGDPRIRGLVEKVVPAVEKFKFYDLTPEDLCNPVEQHYQETEKATNGVVKFFRMAKKKLAEIAAKFSGPVEPVAVGSVPDTSALADKVEDHDEYDVEPTDELKVDLTRGQAAVAEIMANASSTSETGFHKADSETEETVVIAVVDGETVIPGVDQISIQLKATANKLGSAVGVTNFFRRLATVKRNHSVVDLLKFMEKGELPIADDGTILVYKRLNAHGQGDTRYFTDVHSGQVKQKVGSHVFMAESLVDPNRNRDCSNGLHIARRDYLGAFSGNVVVLCKLAPEDVISVPIYDARKLRAKGYTIVAELNDTDSSLVKSNKPMQDKVLLGNVAAGNHTAVLETVEITQQRGGGLIVTPVGHKKAIVMDEAVKAESLDAIPEADAKMAKINPRDIALGKATTREPEPEVKAPVAASPVVSAVVPNSTKRPVDILVSNFTGKNTASSLVAAAHALLDYKKRVKKSWTALGVPIAVWEKATELVTKAEPVVEEPVPAKAPAKKKVTVKETKSFKASAPAVQNIPKKTKVEKVKPVATEKTPVKKTQAEHVAGLIEVFKRVPCKSNAMAIVDYKRVSKKSWDVLNVDKAMVKRLMTYDK